MALRIPNEFGSDDDLNDSDIDDPAQNRRLFGKQQASNRWVNCDNNNNNANANSNWNNDNNVNNSVNNSTINKATPLCSASPSTMNSTRPSNPISSVPTPPSTIAPAVASATIPSPPSIPTRLNDSGVPNGQSAPSQALHGSSSSSSVEGTVDHDGESKDNSIGNSMANEISNEMDISGNTNTNESGDSNNGMKNTNGDDCVSSEDGTSRRLKAKKKLLKPDSIYIDRLSVGYTKGKNVLLERRSFRDRDRPVKEKESKELRNNPWLTSRKKERTERERKGRLKAQLKFIKNKKSKENADKENQRYNGKAF